jgi:hypothetical protein
LKVGWTWVTERPHQHWISTSGVSRRTQAKVIFPELQKLLRNVLEFANTRLFVLIDEWSSLPLAIQPYLAEFLKRGLLPLTIVTLKIGALEYRCRFSDQRDSEYSASNLVLILRLHLTWMIILCSIAVLIRSQIPTQMYFLNI